MGDRENLKSPAGGIPGDITHGTVASRNDHLCKGHRKSEYSYQITGSWNTAPPVSYGLKHQSLGPQWILQAIYSVRGDPGYLHDKGYLRPRNRSSGHQTSFTSGKQTIGAIW